MHIVLEADQNLGVECAERCTQGTALNIVIIDIYINYTMHIMLNFLVTVHILQEWPTGRLSDNSELQLLNHQICLIKYCILDLISGGNVLPLSVD